MIIERWVPLIGWLRTYHRGLLTRDVLAAVIVTLMLVPQALAYAMLAGLPPEMGLYASMLPLVLYAVFGTSASLAVGPVAVAALMTASALSSFAAPGSPEYICAALVLAALSGLILIAMGVLRLGFLVNFLSHPVISGFVTASGILIAISQLKHIFGVEASGHNVVELLRALLDQWQQVNVITLLIGLGVWAYLWVCRKRLNGWLTKLGMPASWAGLMVKAAPISAVVVTTLLAWGFQLEQRGVDLVGFVPSGLPAITLPSLDQSLWLGLLPAALLISLVGFVESVSVAQTLAATIIVAVGTLIDLPAVKRTWQYSSSDGVAMVATLLLTLLHSVEVGIISGVVLSLGLHLYRTSQPHSAVVGRVPGTEHFRNVKRHQVETDEHVAMLRIDESLYFANARYLEDTVMALASRSPSIKHIVLTCQAVNVIDASALESLEAINGRLKDAGAMLHLAEVKGPVMDRLTHTAFYHELTGQVFFTTYDAWQALAHPASAGVVSV